MQTTCVPFKINDIFGRIQTVLPNGNNQPPNPNQCQALIKVENEEKSKYDAPLKLHYYSGSVHYINNANTFVVDFGFAYFKCSSRQNVFIHHSIPIRYLKQMGTKCPESIHI